MAIASVASPAWPADCFFHLATMTAAHRPHRGHISWYVSQSQGKAAAVTATSMLVMAPWVVFTVCLVALGLGLLKSRR